jgi:hypothetical protein
VERITSKFLLSRKSWEKAKMLNSKEVANIRWDQQRADFLKTIQEAGLPENVEARFRLDGSKFSRIFADTLFEVYLHDASILQAEQLELIGRAS